MDNVKTNNAFMRKDNSSDFEWTATVINLNHPKIDPNLLACVLRYFLCLLLQGILNSFSRLLLKMLFTRMLQKNRLKLF